MNGRAANGGKFRGCGQSGREASNLWTPAELGSKLTAIWDSTKNVTQSGGLCSAWTDTVGAKVIEQAVGVNKPAVTPSIFGARQALRFDGATSFMLSHNTLAEGGWLTVSAGSIYVAYRPIAISRNSGAVYSDDGILASVGGIWTLSANTGGGGGIQAGLFDGGFRQSGSTPVTPGTAIVATWRHRAGKVGVRANAGAFVESTAGNLTLGNVINVGAGYNSTLFGNFDLGLVLMVNADLTVAEDMAIVAWVRRWGSMV